jgi:hypothetical protein
MPLTKSEIDSHGAHIRASLARDTRFETERVLLRRAMDDGDTHAVKLAGQLLALRAGDAPDLCVPSDALNALIDAVVEQAAQRGNKQAAPKLSAVGC